jgi:hypothetical protein
MDRSGALLGAAPARRVEGRLELVARVIVMCTMGSIASLLLIALILGEMIVYSVFGLVTAMIPARWMLDKEQQQQQDKST